MQQEPVDSKAVAVNATGLAILKRLAQGPSTYIQLADAAGVTSDGARRATRHLLRLRPVLVTYYHDDGDRRCDVLCLTDAGKELTHIDLVERRGGRPRKTNK